MGNICSQAITDKTKDRKHEKTKNKRIYLCDNDGECRSSMCLRGVSDDRPTLSNDTLEVLIWSWDIIKKDIEHVGVVMFMGLLDEDEVKESFQKFRYKSLEELRDSAVLKSHVLKVMGVVDKVVARLHTPDKMVTILHDLGQTHLKLNARPEYLDLVGPQFNLAIQPAMGDKWSPDVEQAWADMFRFITHVMRETMIM